MNLKEDEIDYTKIKKVNIVYKTHLDIGFTDFSENVLKNYVESFIPKAISLAEELNQVGRKKFVWSVGSFLVEYFLKNASAENKERMKVAILQGDICWHGLPFTTHSELMNSDLFEYGVQISKKLDKRFGKTTIASKMTDVPGHTRGSIKHLAKNGIQYLHLGINDASTIPSVPSTFVWQDEAENSIIVDYCIGYGGIHHVKDSDTVMVFAHSGDNLGPPQKEEILENIEKLEQQFPNAKVYATSMDEYAQSILQYKDNLPVVTSEIGDMWIHGAMTDPFKTGLLKEFLALTMKQKERLNSTEMDIIYGNLLLICEHTWGMDFKKYLSDYKNWSKEDFQRARTVDLLSDDYIVDAYLPCLEFAKEEFAKQVKYLDWQNRTYSHFEASHQEQRNYLYDIVNRLEGEHKKFFADRMEQYKTLSLKEEFETYEEVSETKFRIQEYDIVILEDGSIQVNGINFGCFSYELFGNDTFIRYQKEFSHDIEKNFVWAMPDYYKCGYENVCHLKENQLFQSREIYVAKSKNIIMLHLVFEGEVVSAYGCPKNVYVKYEFLDKKIIVELNVLDKEASRLPEALWFSMFGGTEVAHIKYQKLGEEIVYNDVIQNGNRNYHCVEQITLDDIIIKPMHSPLVSLFEKRLYNFNQNFGAKDGGVHFNLYNNLWNTNFKLWYEEDIKSVFEVNFI